MTFSTATIQINGQTISVPASVETTSSLLFNNYVADINGIKSILSSPSGAPAPDTHTNYLSSTDVANLQTFLNDLYSTTINGSSSGRYTTDMINNLNMLFLSLQMVGIDPTNVNATSVGDAKWNTWRNLAVASPILLQVFNFASTATNRTLQSLIELDYVKTGNDMLSTQLSNLQSALSTTQSILSNLTGIQNLANSLTIANRPSLSTIFNLGDASQHTNDDYVTAYVNATSTFFGQPIFPTMQGTEKLPAVSSTLSFMFGETTTTTPTFPTMSNGGTSVFFADGLTWVISTQALSPTYLSQHDLGPPSVNGPQLNESFLSSFDSIQGNTNIRDAMGGSYTTNPPFSYIYTSNTLTNSVQSVLSTQPPPTVVHTTNVSYYKFAGSSSTSTVIPIQAIPDLGAGFPGFNYVHFNVPLTAAQIAQFGLSTPSSSGSLQDNQLHQIENYEASIGVQTSISTDVSGNSSITAGTYYIVNNNTYGQLLDYVQTAILARDDGYSTININGKTVLIPPSATSNPLSVQLQNVFGYTVGDVTQLDQLKQQLVQQRNLLAANITALSASTPASSKSNPNSLLALTKRVYNDITAVFTANGQPIGSATALGTAMFGLSKWILDSYNSTSTNAGLQQQHLTAAITAGENLNTQQQQNVQSFLFLFEEYYKSASAILQQITQIISRMAQHISQ